MKLDPTSVWLTWLCFNTDEHPDTERVEQSLSEIPEVGTAICPSCGNDMELDRADYVY